MSDFSVPVIRLTKASKLPNSDALSITEVEGCPVIFKTTDLNIGDFAVYVPIESMVPLDNPVFKFLKPEAEPGKFYRIKAKKLRGTFSMGLLIPLKAFEFDRSFKEGFDLAPFLNICKFEEIEEVPTVPVSKWTRFVNKLKKFFGIKKAKGPDWPVYDVSHYRKYKHVLNEGEDVIVTEKVHGSNFRAGYNKNKFYIGSHRVIKGKEDESFWWKVGRKYDLKNKLKKYPDYVFYGEVIGSKVQDLEYDMAPGELDLLFFDIYDNKLKKWLEPHETSGVIFDLDLKMVPLLYFGPYSKEKVEPLASGKSTIAKHIKEGVVIRPEKERNDRCGRVVLKLISEQYLLRKDPTERH